MPSDEEMLKMKELMDSLVNEYKMARDSINNPSITSTITDSMPF